MSSLPLPVTSQGALSPPAPHLEVSPGAHVPASIPVPAPATQIAANHTTYVPATVSSYGGLAFAPPPGRHSSPTLLERSLRSGPDLLPGVGRFGRLIAYFKGNKTVPDNKVHYHDGTVGARLQPTVDIAEARTKAAAEKAYQIEWCLNCAIALQVFIGALTTALGAVLSGKNTSVAISILGGAATLVASYMARMRSSSEPEASRFRAKTLDRFLREVQAFQLDHNSQTGSECDKEIEDFRSRLEIILSKSGKVKNHSEAAGPRSGSHAADRAPGSNHKHGLSANDPESRV
ncbi:hypothetical protein EDB87DRAFT_1261554 [Lactarius vividus]|nr:hypothetical protein EDB87DRAFT_1261554 [Lactarius vividus]